MVKSNLFYKALSGNPSKLSVFRQSDNVLAQKICSDIVMGKPVDINKLFKILISFIDNGEELTENKKEVINYILTSIKSYYKKSNYKLTESEKENIKKLLEKLKGIDFIFKNNKNNFYNQFRASNLGSLDINNESKSSNLGIANVSMDINTIIDYIYDLYSKINKRNFKLSDYIIFEIGQLSELLKNSNEKIDDYYFINLLLYINYAKNYDTFINNNKFQKYKSYLFRSIISSNNINLDNLFRENNKLFDLFKHNNQSPFSDYDFLEGIDTHTVLNSERTTAGLIGAKASMVLATVFPHFAFKVLGITILSTTGVGGLAIVGTLIAHVLARYGFEIYRKQKRRIIQTIKFCTKYAPFIGLEHYMSNINEIYHRIFYYKKYGEISDEEKYKYFFNGVCGNDEDFINQNILFISYLDKYSEELIRDNNAFIAIKIDEKTYKKLSEQITESLSSKNSTSSSNFENTIERNSTSSSNFENTKRGNSFTHPNRQSLDEYLDEYKGGQKFNSMIDNTTGIEKIKTKKVTNIISDMLKSPMYNITFRLNYKIDENYILTSGDITVENLYLELFYVINSRSTYLKGEASILSLKTPFFVDDFLVGSLKNLRDNINKVSSILLLRILISDFIKQYFIDFTELYMLAKHNIYVLLRTKDINSDDLLLESMFEDNLEYTLLGRYPSSISNEAKLRDKLNYYCTLCKYCRLALDHIVKKFKISIYKDSGEIFDKNKTCEKSQDSEYLKYYTKESKPNDKLIVNPYRKSFN